MFLHSIVWNAVNYFPPFFRYKAFDYRARKNIQAATSGHNVNGLTSAEFYWQQYKSENKIALVRYIADRFKFEQLAILDFGCHCGNTLRLIDEMVHTRLDYSGIDPNAANLAFAKAKFERSRHNCSFLIGSDDNLASLTAGMDYDIFLVSSVFYAMSPSRVRHVLDVAKGCAKHIIIADDLSQMKASSTILTKSFVHPYCKFLNAHGFQIEHTECYQHPEVAYTGFLCARPVI